MPWCEKILPGMSQAFKDVLPKEAGIKGLCHQDINLASIKFESVQIHLRNLLRNISLVHVEGELGDESNPGTFRVAQQYFATCHCHHLETQVNVFFEYQTC